MGQLGDLLRERRIALGLSLDAASESTRIRAKLLDALEQGDYDRLPDPGYVKGYVSSYASYLELDPAPLLAMYRAETGSGGRSRDIAPAPEAVKPRGQQHAVPRSTAIVAVLVIALLSLGIWFVIRTVRGPQTPPPIPSAGSQVATAGADAATATASSTVEASIPAPVAQTVPFTLKVTVAADGASWLKITVDGLKAYEGSLAGGQSKEFEVTKNAEVRVGKPSFVTVYRDGAKVPIPTGAGTPTIKLTAEPAQ